MDELPPVRSTDAITALADELAIKRLLAEYCHRVDDGRLDELAQLFTIDGEFVFGSLSARGRGEVTGWFERFHPPAERGKHLTTNVVVELDAADGDRASARSDFAFLGFRDGQLTPTLAGRYDDELQRVDGRWLIGRRDASQLRPSV
jgi:hypothetical protein